MTRILIADDHPVIRTGLRNLLQGTEFKVVGEAATAREVVGLARTLKPDVLLLDVCLPDEDGVTALGRIRLELPHLPVLMLSTFDNPTFVARSMALGAGGYVLKTVDREELLQALRCIAAGQELWTLRHRRQIAAALASPRGYPQIDMPLTAREASVLDLIAQGKTNRQIAELLQISSDTAKEHVQSILTKLCVSDRTQAAVWAVRKGVVH